MKGATVKIPYRINPITGKKFKSRSLLVFRCEFCNVEFLAESYRARRIRFCSHKCKSCFGARLAGAVAIEKYRGTGSKTYVKFYGRHEHRVVAEKKIERPLGKGEIVHHIDGNKKNNSPDNLQVMTQSQHVKLHHAEMMAKRKLKAGY